MQDVRLNAMKKTPLLLLPIVIGLALFVTRPWSRFLATPSPASTTSTISVVTTFYPLAYFAEQVGGDLVTVRNITPAGAEPHDYEPTSRDIAAAYDADLFILNGEGLDPWADKLAPDLASKGVYVLRMNEHVKTQAGDPHFWLDLLNVFTEVEAIADALIDVDPKHIAQYAHNRDTLLPQLIQLHEDYRAGLANCERNEIVTTHDAFGYLARLYRFNTLHILGLSPDEEPSPQTIAQVADTAKARNINYIFFETLVSPKLAETIAAEIGAQTLVLNPLEGLTEEELRAGKNYISVMQENLVNLRLALVCQ